MERKDENIPTDFSFSANDFEFKFYNKALGHAISNAEIVAGWAARAFELNLNYKLCDTLEVTFLTFDFYDLICNSAQRLVLLFPKLFHSFELSYTRRFEKCGHKDK